MNEQDTPKHLRRSIGAQRNPDSAEAILDAAENVLAEEGYRGFSIEKVARRAKAGKPTIYRWWPSKAALLLDVYMRQKSVVLPDTGCLDEDIVRFVIAILRQWRETPTGTIFRSIICESQGDTVTTQELRIFADAREEDMTFLVWRALKRKEIKEDAGPREVCRWIGAWLWYRLLTGDLDVDEAAVRREIGLLISGLRPH